MLKRIQKTDYIFIAAILICLIFHIICMYTPVPYDDETLYPTGPLRFINGDIMMQHEWHLSQFSSLFSHLPVLLWITLKGSTEGLILFLRIAYLLIHTSGAVIIYKSFREYKYWAVMAAVLFYTQTPYRMLAISYISMVVFFLLLMGISLFFAYKTEKKQYYILSGIFFGACCVCNPFYCLLYPVYIAVYLYFNLKVKKNKSTPPPSDKKASSVKRQVISEEKNTSALFFSKKAVLLISSGIAVMAVISILYYFSTGGTISSFIGNFGNLLSSSEYDIFNSLSLKLRESVNIINKLSLNMPFLLPVLFIALAADKRRYDTKHKILYVILSLFLSILYVITISISFFNLDENTFAISLPFLIFSSVCYILTKNKNKPVFFLLCLPFIIGAVIQYIATNTGITAPFSVLALTAVPGMIFVCDFYSEIKNEVKAENKPLLKNRKKAFSAAVFNLVCIILCIQTAFNCCLYMHNKIPNKESYQKVENGPFAGLYLDSNYYEKYNKGLSDLDIIKERSSDNDPVLINSRMGWMHLYIDRPSAAYCAALYSLEEETFRSYYEQNPDKIPKYIYVSFAHRYYLTSRDEARKQSRLFQSLFDCTVEELSMGFLLTVDSCRFDLPES